MPTGEPYNYDRWDAWRNKSRLWPSDEVWDWDKDFGTLLRTFAPPTIDVGYCQHKAEADKFTIYFKLPGIKQESLSVKCDCNGGICDMLTIKAEFDEKLCPSDVVDKKFKQDVRLRKNYFDIDKMSAFYKNGMLIVVVPIITKLDPKNVKEVPVSFSS